MNLDDDWTLIDALLGAVLCHDTLSDFEKQFTGDAALRYETEGSETRFSNKQWRIIRSIKAKTCDRRIVAATKRSEEIRV